MQTDCRLSRMRQRTVVQQRKWQQMRRGGGKTGKPVKAAGRKAAAKKAKPAEKQEPEEKTLTMEEVRGVLAEKSRAGHTEEVKALLNKHGADKLSEIDPTEYAALLAEGEAL